MCTSRWIYVNLIPKDKKVRIVIRTNFSANGTNIKRSNAVVFVISKTINSKDKSNVRKIHSVYYMDNVCRLIECPRALALTKRLLEVQP